MSDEKKQRSTTAAPEKQEAEEYMSESTDTSESESEYSSEEEEEEEVLFKFSLSYTNSRKIKNSGHWSSNFCIDVTSECARLGADIRKKSGTIRIRSKRYTLKFSCDEDDGDSVIQDAFDEISNVQEGSDEAKSMAILLCDEGEPEPAAAQK
tara:strand:- start:55 stop:510 length:456 start_codon:yes stop_codon:yes gene_type:complete